MQIEAHMLAFGSQDFVDIKLIEQAVDLLREGRLVAFPTETVYGLGVDASSLDVLKRLYQVKGKTNYPSGYRTFGICG